MYDERHISHKAQVSLSRHARTVCSKYADTQNLGPLCKNNVWTPISLTHLQRYTNLYILIVKMEETILLTPSLTQLASIAGRSIPEKYLPRQ